MVHDLVWAGITPTNQASSAVVEKLGFKRVREQEMHFSYLLQVSSCVVSDWL